jgi:hypothetical protein
MLKLGDIVHGKLIEAIDDNHWIVSFNGTLMQVKNTSPIPFEKDKIIKLRISRERPLELQLYSGRNFSFSLDVKV